MNTPSFRRAAMAAVVAAASAGVALDASAATPGGTIVMARAQQSVGEPFPNASSLWLLDVASQQARPLTALQPGVFDMAATWAPNGSAFVFERDAARSHRDPLRSLQVMSAASKRPRALLHGAGDYALPAWGPTNRIAYITRNSGGQCVAVVDGSGRKPRTLFCAPASTELARPQWSKDGARLFVAGSRPEGRLEPIFHALAYRIDANTGSTRLLSDIVMDAPLALAFSPDGTRGVYADVVANEMTLVDFRSGATTALPRGHAPLWSPDGRRIAFTGEVYEVGEAFRYYEPLYVMDADGSRVRRLTDSRVDNHAYTAAQWSKDNVHVLVNRRTFADVSLTRANFALRIVDADTRTLLQLPAGYAAQGAWFEP